MESTGKAKGSFNAADYYRDTPKSGTPAAELLTSARLHMLQKFPFWGKLAQTIVFVETDKIPTTGVDPKCRLYYNPKWVNSWTFEDAVGEICHETGHLYQRFFSRRGNRDHGIFNIAADYCIDTHLEDAGVPRSFASKLMVGKEQMDLVHKLKMIEPVYDHLLKDMKQNTNCQACKQALDKLMKQSGKEDEEDRKANAAGKGEKAEDGDPGEGEGEGDEGSEGEGDSHNHGAGEGDGEGEGEGDGKGEPQHTCGNIRQCGAGCSTDTEKSSPMDIQKGIQNLIAAKMWAESKGNMPADIGGQIDELTRSRVRWQDHLRTAANKQFSKVEYTYKAPNRRAYSSPCRLPTVRKESKSAVIGFDTSGSMSRDSIIQCFTEAQAIIRACGCDKLWVILADCMIHFSGYVGEADLTKLQIHPGGTSHKEVFQALTGKHPNAAFNVPSNERVELAILFTDLGTDFPEEAPPFPVIWGVPDPSYPGMKAEVPFGKKIPVEL